MTVRLRCARGRRMIHPLQVVEVKQAGAAGVLGVIGQVNGRGTAVMSSFAAAVGLDAPVEVRACDRWWWWWRALAPLPWRGPECLNSLIKHARIAWYVDVLAAHEAGAHCAPLACRWSMCARWRAWPRRVWSSTASTCPWVSKRAMSFSRRPRQRSRRSLVSATRHCALCPRVPAGLSLPIPGFSSDVAHGILGSLPFGCISMVGART